MSIRNLLLTYAKTIDELNKLRHRYIGLFKILRLRNNAATLKLLTNIKMHLVFNVDRLKINTRDSERPRSPPPTYRITQGKRVYEVERVIEHRQCEETGAWEFRVRWKNFDKTYNK